jgi:hypothetical protein
MEHAYSRSVFFQTITHWALGLKTAKSRDRPVPLPHQNAQLNGRNSNNDEKVKKVNKTQIHVYIQAKKMKSKFI